MMFPFAQKIFRTTVGRRDTIGRNTSWLWQAGKGYRLQATLNTGVGILMVLADLAFVWATKQTIDVATHSENDVALYQTLLLLAAILLVEILLGIVNRWIKAILGVKAQNSMRSGLFAHLLNCKWKDQKSYHSGDLLNRLEKDVSTVVTFLTESLPQLVTTLVQFTGAFLFLFYLDRTLAVIIIALLPVFLIISRLYFQKMKALTHRVRTTESRIQALMQESVQHGMVIKTLERCTTIIHNLSVRQDTLCHEVREKTKYATVSSTIMNIGFSTGYLVTFGWGVFSLQQEAITYGVLIAFIQLVGQIQVPARNLTKFIPIFISTYTAAERLREIEAIPAESADPPHRLTGEVGLHFSKVTFAYTASSRHILNQFDFDIPPRSRLAILGETGSGKTTLVRLLLSLIEPTEGSIVLYNNKETLPISPSTRCNFSYVPQGNTLLSGTIRSNLLLGNPEAQESEMHEALRLAAADFVFNLPAGLDTPCGEQGGGLSEGQAQRISIARTLLRKAPILLFDEATSALDNKTEEKVVRNIVERFPDQILIFITHRPKVLDFCPLHLYLKHGKND